jgi:hypothetical protein
MAQAMLCLLATPTINPFFPVSNIKVCSRG